MEKGTFSISKSTVECYKIRHSTGMYWADITIDANGKTGRIQIASDFDDYQYYWGACGVEFKEFLAKLDIHYTAGKFGCNRWFDVDKTLEMWRSEIKESVADKKEKVILLQQVQSLSDYIHEQEFISEAMQCSELMDFYNHCPDLVRDITPQFKKFWQYVWPVLLDEFKKEREGVTVDNKQ